MPKTSEVAEITTLTDDDYVLAIDDVDGTPITSRISWPNFKTVLATWLGITKASSSGPTALAFYEDTDNGSNKVTVKAPASISSDADLTLPGIACTLGMLGMPQNIQSVDYTTVLTDADKHIFETGASKTVTIAANASVAYPIGTRIKIIGTNSTGVTVAMGGTDTLVWVDDLSVSSRVIEQYRIVTAIKVDTTIWFLEVSGKPTIPQNSKSAAYTTVWSDAGKHILHPAADNNARTFTIDSNANVAYPIGTAITFINEINTVTIAITSDTLTLAGSGSTGSRTLAANGMATAIKITSTKWMISGSGLT